MARESSFFGLMSLGSVAFLSASDYHHYIGLNTWESAGGQPPPTGTTGLYHFASTYPARRDLAAALVRLLDGGWGIDGASDHGTHEAIYLHDPEFNGIELAWDRPADAWPRRDGALILTRAPLGFPGPLAELGEARPSRHLATLTQYR